MSEASKPHSMYENEHAEYLFAKVLAPHVCRMPLEQDRLDACHHLARLVEQLEVYEKALREIERKAVSGISHPGIGQIAREALNPASEPKPSP